MSQPRGRGGNPGRNAGQQPWGPGSQQGRNEQSQNQPPNFSSDDFGPPLGGRARRNRQNQGPPTNRAPPPQNGGNNAWGARAQPIQQVAAAAPPASAPRPAGNAWGAPTRANAPNNPTPVAVVPPPAASQPASSNQSRGAIPRSRPAPTTDAGPSSAPRDAVRGERQERSEALIQTRPTHITEKQGRNGRVFKVKSNYFELRSALPWQIFHYHVEFTPEIENPLFRNALLVQQRPTLGGFLYDKGASIYTVTRLQNDDIEIITRDRDQREILIKIKRVGLISPLENRSLQVLNIIMKKALKELNLQLVQRDYYDAEARININEHHLQLWPGYTTSIRQHERSLLMMAEVKHKVGPAQRIARLLQFNNRLQTTPGSLACFNDWGLNLDRSLVDVNARELPPENILLGGNGRTIPRNADWTNAFQGRGSMYKSVELVRLGVVIPDNLKRESETFIRILQEVANGMQFKLNPPIHTINVRDDRSNTLSGALNELCGKNLQMILVFVSNNQADRYSNIKKVCCVRNGVPSQVVTGRVLRSPPNKLRSVATKVAIQMNSKIGGLPWNVDVRLSNMMCVGYDVCHDTSDKSRSYGALVATMDMKCQNPSGRFFSRVTAHVNGEELSNNMGLDVVAAVHEYHKIHNRLPDRILFYRDGVGEGQTNYVYHHELSHLRKVLGEVYKDQPLRLAFIIVSKRINTKFFVQQDKNSVVNVPPGTVVDDVVTLPERYDFFLVSQAVNQGTATPTNYNVLFDSFGLPPEKLQQLTYVMCHLYYNWSGTTRVPAVCQYAHKLAFLVGNFLHQQPSHQLSQLLYFL